VRPRKLYANSLLLRAEVFHRFTFCPVGPKSRGACSRLLADLTNAGVPVRENRRARVAHPPPSDFGHLAARAFAHGRDHSMKVSEGRSLAGLRRSVGIARSRWIRGLAMTLRLWRQAGRRWWEVPAVAGILTLYYVLFASGALLTLASPAMMARHFRV
jgi:hypothetical protein